MTELLIGTTDGLFALAGGREQRPVAVIEGREVGALAHGDEAVWAIADGRAILRSPDGRGWTEVDRHEELRLTCVLPVGSSVLAGTSEAHLLSLEGEGLEPREGFDRVAGRDDWYTPWGGPPDTRSLTAGGDGTLFANVHVGGIPMSSDGGRTWRPTIDPDQDVHQVLAHPSIGGLVLAPCAYGLAVSRDGGASWETLTDGLHATYSRAVGVTGGTILVTVSDSHRGAHAAVYRIPETLDRPFEKCSSGLPEWFDANIDTGCLSAADGMVAFGTPAGEVFVSHDEGSTWELGASGLPSVRSILVR